MMSNYIISLIMSKETEFITISTTRYKINKFKSS